MSGAWVRLSAKRKDARADLAGLDGNNGEAQLTANGELRTRDDDACTYLAMLAGALTVTAGEENGSSEIVVTIAGGRWRSRVRIWVATTDFGAPSATGNTVSVSKGTTLRAITANADYEVLSAADGESALTITVAGAADRYVMAEVAGRTYSSGKISWAA